MATVTPQKRKLESYSESPIIVEVGEQNEKIYIHRDVLIKTSKYFNSYLSGRWTVGDIVKPPDPDTEAHTFHIYTHWLYSKDIDLSPIEPHRPEQLDPIEYQLEELTKLYILGNTTEDMDFRNAVMRKMYDHFNDHDWFTPTMKTYHMAFEKTDSESTLCLLLMDEIVIRADHDWLKEHIDNLPMPLMKELTLLLSVYNMHIAKEYEHGIYAELPEFRENRYEERDMEAVRAVAQPKPKPKPKPAKKKRKAAADEDSEEEYL